MADEVSRGAARTATLVALPIALLVGVVAFWMLGGFGGGTPDTSASRSATPQPSSTVSVAASALPDRAGTVCRALIATLPGTVRSLQRRPVSAGSEQNAAYGTPPLRLRCGVPTASVAPDATVYPLAGVCYIADKQSHRSVWTTVDREVPISITVPGSYDGAGQWVAEFSDSITGAVKSLHKAPTGCGE